MFQDDDQIFQTYETFSEPSKIDALVEALRNLAIRLEPLQGDKWAGQPQTVNTLIIYEPAQQLGIQPNNLWSQSF